ncbi:10257_t:CDS:2, partial [Dentiscutata erythropus]
EIEIDYLYEISEENQKESSNTKLKSNRVAHVKSDEIGETSKAIRKGKKK